MLYGYRIDTFQGAQTLRFPLNDQIQNNTSRTLIEITGYPVDSLDAYFNDAHKDILSEKNIRIKTINPMRCSK
jgi:hypothetical protein